LHSSSTSLKPKPACAEERWKHLDFEPRRQLLWQI